MRPTILVATSDKAETDDYLARFRSAWPHAHFVAPGADVDARCIEYAAIWSPPAGVLAPYTQLRAVFALGAGVDKLLARADLPQQVALHRVLDGGMARQMIEYVRWGVLSYQRHMDVFRRQQGDQLWRKQPPRRAADVRVGVLGLGAIGAAVAGALQADGYCVSGWTRRERRHDGIACHFGAAGLDALLSGSDVVVGILPSTAETRGLLDHRRLALLPRGAMVINAGRGDLIDETALLALLDDGHVRCALLDVCVTEPLPAGHPFWSHPAITLTPHCAATTIKDEAVNQVVEHLQRLAKGEALPSGVDRSHGY
ncbi:2-hydroxyacid dehydrogenase [Chitinibacteraceae bacterium HSL-7]